jgi:hypothetical protein
MNVKYNSGSDLSISDVEFLMNSIGNGHTYEMVSSKLKKDVTFLKKTLLSIICQRIENQEGIEAYFCNEYGVTPIDIQDFKNSQKL